MCVCVCGGGAFALRVSRRRQRLFGWGEALAARALGQSRQGFVRPGRHRRGYDARWGAGDLSLRTARAIADAEACDVALHDFAVALLAARLGAMTPRDAAALATFAGKARAVKSSAAKGPQDGRRRE